MTNLTGSGLVRAPGEPAARRRLILKRAAEALVWLAAVALFAFACRAVLWRGGTTDEGPRRAGGVSQVATPQAVRGAQPTATAVGETATRRVGKE